MERRDRVSPEKGQPIVQVLTLVRPERSRRAFGRRSGKPPDPVPIAGDERFLLRPRPALDAAFECKRLVARRSRLAPDQLDRPPASRPVTAYAPLVLPEASFEIVRVPRVVGTVATAQ